MTTLLKPREILLNCLHIIGLLEVLNQSGRTSFYNNIQTGQRGSLCNFAAPTHFQTASDETAALQVQTSAHMLSNNPSTAPSTSAGLVPLSAGHYLILKLASD